MKFALWRSRGRTLLLGGMATFGAWMLAGVQPALAIPAFSSQTGQACAACHVSGMGPQLTPFGRKFKLSGYSDSVSGKGFTLPVSVMVDASLTHTKKDQTPSPSGFNSNENKAVDEVSLFFGGRIVDRLGAFIQTTWERNGNAYSWTWDNADIRYGHDVALGGLDSTVGVSLNNSPTVTDIYNSTPVWGFPYQGSVVAPAPAASPLLESGLGQRTVGATAYGLFADTVYAEIGGYVPLGGAQQDFLGSNVNDGAQLKGVAPYWRLALQRDLLKQNFSVGTFGILANVLPNNDSTTGLKDKYRDYGFDATYQWLGNRKHIFTANSTALFERRDLQASEGLASADNAKGNLRTYKINGSYWYDQTYGVTVGGFKTSGSSDATLYESGSANGSPNTTGYVMEVDWTPFGKKDSVLQPWANLQLGLQYTGYTKFNGASSNYDGNGRSASDNNTLMLLMRTAL